MCKCIVDVAMCHVEEDGEDSPKSTLRTSS